MTLLISRSGIAAAAGVQRPVVSMWQRRPVARGAHVPFPDPSPGEADLFDLDEVIEWQRRTGRGNSTTFADDAPLFATTAEALGNDPLTALLALAAATGLDPADTDPETLVATAAGVDPADEMLLSEVRAAAGSTELRVLAQRKIEAAYGAAAAIEAAMTARVRSGVDRSWVLTDPAIALIGTIAHALAPQGLVASDGGAAARGDLALRVALADPERGTGWSASAEASGASAAETRLMRRRALAAGLDADAVAVPVVLAQVPNRLTPGLSPAQVLRAIDDVALALRPGAVAVVVGPAAVLCDAPADREAVLVRADVLRTGRLRAALRLPAGLLVDKPRAELGLWLLGDADPTADVGDRLIVAGDASGTPLTSAVVDGLASDLVAALGGVAQIRVRAFAHARPVPTSRLLAVDDALVPRARPAPDRGVAAEASVLALAALAELRGAGLGDGVDVTVDNEPQHGRYASVAELCAAGDARVIQGRRPDPEAAAGSVPVVGPEQVLGHPVQRHVDALVARGVHGRAVTEPGDVVFVAVPRPAALVDDDGGSLVSAPARILRLRAGSPRAVEAAINAMPASAAASRYRSWLLPVPAAGRAAGLEAALAQLDRERRALAERIEQLTALTNHLVDGVTSGALAVETDAEPTNEGGPRGTNRAS